MSGHKEIVFECGHKRLFPSPYPKKGDWLWCPSCRKERQVMNAPDEWRIRCMDCGYARGFGASKTDSERAIGKHRTKRPGHRVKQFDGNKFVKLFEYVSETLC